MRLQDEFAMYEAQAKENEKKELAASIAREYNLPDSDAGLLVSHEDERMMRVLAKRFAEDRPETPEEQLRRNVSRFNRVVDTDSPTLSLEEIMDRGLRGIKHVGEQPYQGVPRDQPSNFG